MKRDVAMQAKARPKGRPKWGGPIPDRYYYRVKNKRHPHMSAFVVLFTDDPQYEGKVRQIVCVKNGHWSLIESDVPLPTGSNCKLTKHSKVEDKKDKLFWTHDQNDPDSNVIPGKPVEEDEVFD